MSGAAEIQQKLSETQHRLSAIDSERRTAEDSGEWAKIPALDAERDHLLPVLQSLQSELAAAEEVERAERREDLARRIAQEFQTFRQAECHALDDLAVAIQGVSESVENQRKFVSWARAAVDEIGGGGPITVGAVTAIRTGPLGKAIRLEADAKYVGTELAIALLPLFENMGERNLWHACYERRRAGNRLPKVFET